MRKIQLLSVSVLSLSILLSGCKMNNTAKGGLIGGGAGAALGAGIGKVFGNSTKSTVIGAAVGAAVGTTAGILIGKKMDKQKAELAAVKGAKVETVTDANNLQAIKVTFSEGILFQTGKSVLNTGSKTALTEFANSLKNNTNTDVTIYGHTDNTGSDAINEKLSAARADAVKSFLSGNGIAGSRMTTEGKSYSQPVADNSTTIGRAQNRRVEVYITANETMIKEAEKAASSN